MGEKRWKWVKLGENPKCHIPNVEEASKLVVNNNDAQSITKFGFPVWPDAQIVALCTGYCPPRP